MEMVLVSLEFSDVLKVEQVASDLVLAWVEVFEPAEKLGAFVDNTA